MTSAENLRAAQPVVISLAGIFRELLEQSDEHEVLQRLADATRDLFEADDVGILLGDRAALSVVVATSSEAEMLDLLQLQNDDGPCLNAYRTGSANLIADVSADQRWPEWLRVAEALGYRSAATAPMRHHDRSLGTIIALSKHDVGLGEPHVETLEIVADITTLVLITSRDRDDDRRTNEQLQSALVSRVVIEQAKGVIAERNGISVDAAFDVLRDHARRERAKLAVVAQSVIDGTLLVEPRAPEKGRKA